MLLLFQEKTMDEQFEKRDESETEIDLLELLKVIKKNLLLLVTCTFIGMLVAFSFTYLFIPKTYRSVSTIYIKPSVKEGVVNYNEVLTNQKLTTTYSVIAKSKSVIDQVTSNLSGDNISEKLVRESITVSSVKDTEIISITSTTRKPELSADIANEVVDVFMAQISSIMTIDNLRIIDRAVPVNIKVGPNTTLNTLIGGFLGLGLATAFVLIKKLLDRTIHNRQDAESLLQLPVLGEIAYDDETN
jgi:capsular polysaccharide biosynthesis protein